MIAQAILAVLLIGGAGDGEGSVQPVGEFRMADDLLTPAEAAGAIQQLSHRNRANGIWSPLDSLELFGGLDGSKQPQDFGVNAQFGVRFHANWGVPVSRELGLGIQVGTALNASDHAVRVTQAFTGAASRNQSFTTVGVFQRTPSGWVWGIVHDFLYTDDYDRFFLSQWRGRAGYQISDAVEVGVQGRASQKKDTAVWGPANVRLRPLAQGSVYWRHTWDYGSQVGCWLGVAESHGQANAALGNDNPTGPRVVFGSDLHLPLNDHVVVFGEANFVTPAATGTVDAFLGFAFYPGGHARLWRQRACSPVLPVANNTSFTVDLR